MARPLLAVTQVSKRYSLRPRARLLEATSDTLRELCGLPARQGLRDGEFWALENIDLRIEAGEVIGVIGHNGAGKSTLMNLVSGIVLPTTGSIAIHTDKVCRIDHAGVLSTQETGRENIRMQLALYGVPVADTEAETEAIASFADLHEQLDAPVGTYSSGMRSRLGFAIYARLHPDLFLVDEGIGGGDRRFRERFRGFITDYVAGGGSMLFAMHDTHMIQTLCDRVLLLDQGRAVLTADAPTAIDAYNRLAVERGLPPLPVRRPKGIARQDQKAPTESRESIVVDSITLTAADGGPPRSGMQAGIVVTVRTTQHLDDVAAAIAVSRGEIAPLATIAGPGFSLAPPGGTLRCTVGCMALVPGEYEVRVKLYDRQTQRLVGPTDGSGRAVFRVEPGGGHGDPRGRGGLLHLPAVWETEPLVDPVADDASTIREDPYPTYRRWLERPGPFYSEQDSAWIVSHHDQVSALFRDPSVSNRIRAEMGILGATMMAHDPPDHGRLRGLVADAFSGAAVRALEPRITAITGELIDGVADLPRFDFVECFADRLPGRLMTDLLGLPEADLPMLVACADMTGGPEMSARNMERLADYFEGIITQRQLRPGDDLVSALVAAHDPGGLVSMKEVLATCVLLLLAGYETTSHLLANGMLLLLQHPEQYARLRENPDLMGPAVEEMLRFESPTQFPPPRAAKAPLVIGGQSIAAGDLILACLGAANRDPAVFPDPDRFDIGRAPNRHLAFGFGIHVCPGALLSRTEARILFTMIEERLGELHLDVADPRTFRPTWRRRHRLRGLKSLPVRR